MQFVKIDNMKSDPDAFFPNEFFAKIKICVSNF